MQGTTDEVDQFFIRNARLRAIHAAIGVPLKIDKILWGVGGNSRASAQFMTEGQFTTQGVQFIFVIRNARATRVHIASPQGNY